MSKINTVTGTAPSHWASYFINGDPSGMTDGEIEQADKFQSWLCGTEGYIVDCSNQSEFITYHDARRFGVLAADCYTYTAIVE